MSGTTGGKSVNYTFGYTSAVVQSGIYNVTSTMTTNGTSYSFVFIVDSNNNSVISASVSGFTVTGAEAAEEFTSIMGIFGFQDVYANELSVYTNPAYFVNQGTTTGTFGPVSFPVTTYGLKSPNETFTTCGVSATITAFTLQVGTPPGTSLQFITYIHFAGTANGSTGDYTFQLVSMTIRS
jgi:hypothetical protein